MLLVLCTVFLVFDVLKDKIENYLKDNMRNYFYQKNQNPTEFQLKLLSSLNYNQQTIYPCFLLLRQNHIIEMMRYRGLAITNESLFSLFSSSLYHTKGDSCHDPDNQECKYIPKE